MEVEKTYVNRCSGNNCPLAKKCDYTVAHDPNKHTQWLLPLYDPRNKGCMNFRKREIKGVGDD